MTHDQESPSLFGDDVSSVDWGQGPSAKACTRCGQEKPLASFAKGSDRFGKSHRCMQCNADRLRQWRSTEQGSQVHKRANRRGSLRRYYGMTIETYERMAAEQGGRCAICRQRPMKKDLNVDHDHVTGQIRRLLCGPCNRGLGQFKDNPEFIRRAAEYLEAYEKEVPSDPLRDRFVRLRLGAWTC